MALPDMIRFEVEGNPAFEWSGPWPPPERMWLAIGRESGIIKPFRPEHLEPGVFEELQRTPTIDLVECERVSASSLPDDFSSDRVFRGADYRPLAGQTTSKGGAV